MKIKILAFLLVFGYLGAKAQTDSTAKQTIGQLLKNATNKVLNKAVIDAKLAPAYYTDATLINLLATRDEKKVGEYIDGLPLENRVEIQKITTAYIHLKTNNNLNASGIKYSDLDNDGHTAASEGGDDCDDLNPYVNPGVNEKCKEYNLLSGDDGKLYVWNSSLADEDCDYCTVASKGSFSDGDLDKDGLIDCKCYNLPIDSIKIELCFPRLDTWSSMATVKLANNIMLTHGVDCDDNNPALTANSQKCLGNNKVLVCINGKWETKECKKCIEQANGTGVVVEW